MEHKRVVITTHIFTELIGKVGFIESEEKHYYVVKLDDNNDPLKALGIAISKTDVAFI